MDQIATDIQGEDNRDIKLGLIIGLLNQLVESNEKDHKLIFNRLDESDKNTVILKFSRCAFWWLDNNGIIKWAAAGTFVFMIDWVTRNFT